MAIQFYFSHEVYNKVYDYFLCPNYIVQAGFVLAKTKTIDDNIYICSEKFYGLVDDECEYINSDIMNIHASAVLKVLKTAMKNKSSFVFVRTAPAHEITPSIDEKMMFRIAYAYHPFGSHLIIYLTKNEMKGFILSPSFTLSPINIILP